MHLFYFFKNELLFDTGSLQSFLVRIINVYCVPKENIHEHVNCRVKTCYIIFQKQCSLYDSTNVKRSKTFEPIFKEL